MTTQRAYVVWLFILLMGGMTMARPASKYDYTDDPFYQKHPIKVTWVMIWIGSTESWWKPSDDNGCKVLVDGSWQSINWNHDTHIDTYCQAIRDAGIDVIAVDLTNGFRWQRQATRIQKFCHENGMKLVVAFNPQAGKQMESGCKKIWEVYASPETPYHEAYFRKDGKPLAVLYTTRGGYQGSIAIKDVHRNKFSTSWASGEDSDRHKWGWQLDTKVGPVPSGDSMYVTGSVKWSAPGTGDKWRKHLAWLDYGFIMAEQSKPKHLIVGSIENFIWIYHQGKNVYRLIKLNAGLPFEAAESTLHINWDSESDSQRWHLQKTAAGYIFINKANREVLSHNGKIALTEPAASSSPRQNWVLVPQAIIK